MSQGDNLRKRDDWAKWLIPANSRQYASAPTNSTLESKEEEGHFQKAEQDVQVPANKRESENGAAQSEGATVDNHEHSSRSSPGEAELQSSGGRSVDVVAVESRGRPGDSEGEGYILLHKFVIPCKQVMWRFSS